LTDRPGPEVHVTPAQRFDLSGRTALITGGSRGLGREMALAFAEAGADIVVASRKLPDLEDVAEQIRALGREAHPMACHVGHWDQVDELFERAVAATGGIDIVVNNAGMSPLYPSLVEVTEELFDKVVGVNLKGAFRLAALAGAHMQERDGGAILNISSAAAQRPSPTEAVYAAAKAGLDTLTVALAQAYGPEVRVNSILPGMMLTDISKAWDMEAVERRMLPGISLGRLGEPSEIVGAALFLVSDAASYVTGATLRLDGGWLA